MRAYTKGLMLVAALAAGAACGGGDGGAGPTAGVAAAGSAYRDFSYFAELKYLNDGCRARSVIATGPGVSGQVTDTLTCTSTGEWLATIALGPTHPVPPATYSYVFTIDDGHHVFERTATIPCWLETVPTALAPQGIVSSPVTFQWVPLPATQGMEYTVYATAIVSGDVTKHSVIDQASTTTPLASGDYTWFVDVIAVGGHGPGSTKYCSARSTGPAFTVQ
jgi:hypothetical protein